jgi:hypothetical protein
MYRSFSNTKLNQFLSSHHYLKVPLFVEFEILMSRYKLTFIPWNNWEVGSSPNWWSKGYNKIKHERDQYFHEANPVTARKDDAPAAYRAAITNLAGLASFSGGGGLIQTTSG